MVYISVRKIKSQRYKSYTTRHGVSWCRKNLKEVRKTAPFDMVYECVQNLENRIKTKNAVYNTTSDWNEANKRPSLEQNKSEQNEAFR